MVRLATWLVALAVATVAVGANKTATWLDKRAALINDVYGQGLGGSCSSLRFAQHSQIRTFLV